MAGNPTLRLDARSLYPQTVLVKSRVRLWQITRRALSCQDNPYETARVLPESERTLPLRDAPIMYIKTLDVKSHSGAASGSPESRSPASTASVSRPL